MKHYQDRDTRDLDRKGNYYSRHVTAMTGEGLHEKSAIAAELACRDYTIDQLREIVDGQIAVIQRYQRAICGTPQVPLVVEALCEAAVRAEREACLDICSSISEDDFDLAGQVAMEIAKRGEK